MGRINNIPALVQIMAWHHPGDKPLCEPMMVRLLMHIYASLGLNELMKFTSNLGFMHKIMLEIICDTSVWDVSKV